MTAEMQWQTWAGDQELWERPKHWAWSGPCATIKERAHFCTGEHADSGRCRCACGMERPAMTGGIPTKPPQGPECTCTLIDASTWDREPSFVRGDPTGCPRHDTGQAAKRAEAEYRARYGGGG